jgi:ADP-ribose pyrophosphatase YjhB (NUDIX family)
MTTQVHDIFQRGLIRGAERLPFDPAKRYFYVEHPTEGWRVYLRSCGFIHEKPAEGEAVDPLRFAVVKRTGAAPRSKAWEPPKGQMEGKDGLRKGSIMQHLRENVKREVAEEARLKELQQLTHTGLYFESREDDYPPNTFFQYHIFTAVVTPNEWRRASEELQWCREHPDAFARLKRDKREKDDISWYVPSEHRMMGRWSAKIVVMYLKAAAEGNRAEGRPEYL